MRPRRSSLPATVLGLVATCAWPVAGLAAQASRAPFPTAATRDTGGVPRGATSTPRRVAGQIVDATTGEVLAGALVILVLQPEGLLAPAGAGPSAFPAAARQAQTDALGRYQFGALAPGAYRIRASRLGYAPATADVTVGDAAPELSLGLAVAPLALRPIAVRGTPSGPQRLLAGPRGGARDRDVAQRLGALDARRRAYLTTDAREVTRADVADAATLAESDLFRALHRLPGVSTRDDYSAELWTRGTRPDLTRVSLDGMPLFGPVAELGMFSAVNTDAVGSATLLPGVRPAAIGEGGAAVLDLHTRAGGALGGRATSGVGGVGELGVTSARLALDDGSADGRAAWAVSGRRSYVDAFGGLFGTAADRLPNFGDLTVRGDLRLSATQTLAASGLLQHTYASTNTVGLATSAQAAVWGNRVLRVTHAAMVGGFRVTHTAGVSAYAFGGRGPITAPYTPYAPADFTLPPSAALARAGQPDAGVSALLLRGELAPALGDSASGPTPVPTWSAGYEIARQRAHYVGGGRHFFLGSTYDLGDSIAPRDRITTGGALTVGTLWATRRWRPAACLELEPGLRLELAGGADAAAVLRPAPRLAARYTLDADTRLSAALGRSVQYTQMLPPVGLDNTARFYPGAVWLIAGRDAPALTTDLATVGAERWLGGDWLGSVNAYARRTAGFVTLDPAPGLIADRALSVVGREHGRGLELSARRLAGRTTATFAYSWSASAIDAGGYRYASLQDRPHVLDVTLSRRLGTGWHVGGAFAAATGTPYTRTVERGVMPDTVLLGPSTLPANASTGGRVRDVPNARRNPAFLGFDLMAEWTRPVGAWHVGAYAQLHSALAAVISDAYRGDEACYVRAGTAPSAVFGPGARCTVWDGRQQHETIPPVLPAVGLRVAF